MPSTSTDKESMTTVDESPVPRRCPACGKDGRQFSNNQIKKAKAGKPCRCTTCVEDDVPAKAMPKNAAGEYAPVVAIDYFVSVCTCYR